ncbi:MAG: asparaginase, partial [Planctomycetota bacterium]
MTTTEAPGDAPAGRAEPDAFPTNPVLASVWRGSQVESVHRGAFCLVDSSGHVVEEAGSIEHPFFTRSAVKCLQVLPL